jgi:L-seryl-tRNA(Ser) seleniumtransferase
VTLILHRDMPERVPVRHLLGQSEAVLQQRAERLHTMLGRGTIEPSDGFAGGGSLPEERIASRAVVLNPNMGAEAAASALRASDPPVIGRIKDANLLLDVLTVTDDEVTALAAAVKGVLA